LLAADSAGVEEVGKNKFVFFAPLCKTFFERFDPLYCGHGDLLWRLAHRVSLFGCIGSMALHRSQRFGNRLSLFMRAYMTLAQQKSRRKSRPAGDGCSGDFFWFFSAMGDMGNLISK